MKRAAIAVHGLRSGGIRRHGSKAIPLLISLAAPMLGACSLSPVETASTSTAVCRAVSSSSRASFCNDIKVPPRTVTVI